MSTNTEFTKYDEVLLSILVKEESILGFLSAVFNFLARRTDFYYVPKSPDETMGFPAGVAEQLVLKVVKACDPKTWIAGEKARTSEDVHNEIMCSTVAQELEVVADEDMTDEQVASSMENITINEDNQETDIEQSSTTSQPSQSESKLLPVDYEPPVIPVQKNSESYNGAVRDKYTWSQTIMELDVIINLPADIKSSKDLKVVINPGDLLVQKKNGEILIKDAFPYKIRGSESIWSISEGRLLIHLEKAQERWWTRLLKSEEEIELSKIDCSRPLDELPQDHIDKVREMQWNHERKMRGLPTSDELRNIEALKKAWNMDGSPFKGQPFDPSVLHRQ